MDEKTGPAGQVKAECESVGMEDTERAAMTALQCRQDAKKRPAAEVKTSKRELAVKTEGGGDASGPGNAKQVVVKLEGPKVTPSGAKTLKRPAGSPKYEMDIVLEKGETSQTISKNFKSKYYTKARKLAEKNGASSAEAATFARKAFTAAGDIWDKAVS